jgi:hypothetical protein
LDKEIDDFSVTDNINGEAVSSDKINDFKDNLQQAARRKFTKPEYIACPGCGRTMYNLEETFNEVKKRTAHLKGVRIAIMSGNRARKHCLWVVVVLSVIKREPVLWNNLCLLHFDAY